MGRCIKKMAHSCGTTNALQVFEQDDGSLDGYCFNCGIRVSDPLGKGKTVNDIPASERLRKTKEQIAEEIEEVKSYPYVDLPDRKLKKRVLEDFGIRIGLSEQDGTTPTFHYYPYTRQGELVGYKVRHIPTKRMWSLGDLKDCDLFGWEQAKATGAKKLIITEGECDAAALVTILNRCTKEKFKEYIPAVCSLPAGAGCAGKTLAKLAPEIKKHFNEVSFCFDHDAPGDKAIEAACRVFPDATVITLPCKDANECLIEGKAKAAHKAVTFNAAVAKNTRLVWGYSVHEAAKEVAKWGLSTPWDALTQMTRGWRFGETYYLGAGEKMGKSEFVNAIGGGLITDHGLKVMMAKPEEVNKKTYKLLCGKVAGKIFHDPKIEFDMNAYEAAGELVKDNVCMLDLYQHVNWETLQGDIRAAVNEGVKAVFIDPITNLTNGLSSSDINSTLQGIAPELSAMAKDLDIMIFIFCHLNKPSKGNTPWDRGGSITTDYFAGSSAMARSCNYAIGIEGNKDPQLTLEERNMRKLVMLADREFGECGHVDLYWDYKTGLFNEC